MGSEDLHVFTARGSDCEASWDDSARRLEVPRFRLETLATRYLHEVNAGSAMLDVATDDTNQDWFIAGVTRPHSDGHRRDDRLLALLLKWNALIPHMPLDYGKLFSLLVATLDQTKDPRDLTALGQRSWLRLETMSLNGEEPSIGEVAEGVLLGLAHVEKFRLGLQHFSWPFFSRLMSLFPPAFGRQLSVMVTDASLIPKAHRVIFSTNDDPFGSKTFVADGFAFDRSSTDEPHPYVDFLVRQRMPIGDIWNVVRHECEALLEEGWASLWPVNAANDLLTLIGKLLLASDGAHAVQRARHIREIGARHQQLSFQPRVRNIVQLPTCSSLFVRLSKQRDTGLEDLVDAFLIDPSLKVLTALWHGERLNEITATDIQGLETSLPESQRNEFAVHHPLKLLHASFQQPVLDSLSGWVFRPSVLDRLAVQQLESVLIFLLLHADRMKIPSEKLLSLLSRWPDGAQLPMSIEIREKRRCDLTEHCLGLIDRCEPSAARIRLMIELTRHDPALAWFVMGLADHLHRNLLRHFHDHIDQLIEWGPTGGLFLLRRIVRLGELLVQSKPFRNGAAGSRAAEFVNRLSSAFGTPDGGWIRTWWRTRRHGNTPRQVALRYWSTIADSASAYTVNYQDECVQSFLLSRSDSSDGVWQGANSICQIYVFGLCSNGDAQPLMELCDRIDPLQRDDWIDTARDLAVRVLTPEVEYSAAAKLEVARLSVRAAYLVKALSP